MLWLKSCPRCRIGDLHGDRDQDGPFIACLQCGHYLSEEEVVLDLTEAYQKQQTRRVKRAGHHEALPAAA